MKSQRIHGLDIFRGLAILLMMLYHFTYDLNHFNIINIDIRTSIPALITRYTIITMFLLGVGISLALVHKESIKWHSIRKRILYLGLASALISSVTYIIFPNSWIYFGILHFILLSTLLVLPLLKFPKVTLSLALFILLGSISNLLHLHDIFAILQPLLGLPTPHSEDLIPLFPWLGVVLLGTLFIHYNLYKKIFSYPIFNMKLPINKLLKKMGQHSLLIYLLHQPIFFLGFELLLRFSSK